MLISFVWLVLYLWLPGIVALRWSGFRHSVALAAAPAWSCASVLLGTFVLHRVGVAWTPLTSVLSTVLILAGWWLMIRLLKGQVPAIGWQGFLPRSVSALVTSAIVVVSMGVFGFITWKTGGSTHPAQGQDTIFHQNALWLVRETGNGDTFTALAPMFGLNVPASSYYPNIWHSLGATVPHVATPIEVSASMGWIVQLCWLIGLSVWTGVLLPRIALAPALAAAASLWIIAFPAFLLYSLPLWPNALGLAILPGLLALLLEIVRSFSHHHGTREVLLSLIVAVVAVVGGIAAYPGTFFALLVLGLVPAVVLVSRLVGFLKTHVGRRQFIVICVVGVLLLVALAAAFLNPITLGRLAAPADRSGGAWMNKLVSLLLLWPRTGGTLFQAAGLAAIGLLAAIGVVLALRNRRTAWIGGSWIVATLIVLGTLFDIPVLSAFTGVFYSQTVRVVPIQMVVMLPLAVLAWGRLFGIVKGFAEGQQRRLGFTVFAVVSALVIAAVGLVATFGARVSYESNIRLAKPGSGTYTYDEEELALLERVGDVVDDGKSVLGDPTTGAALVQVVGGVRAALPHGTLSGGDWDAQYLSRYFRDIATDPMVCTILNQHNIGYFYSDQPRIFNQNWRDTVMPGFYGVDTGNGFELVDAGGSARLYRITACD